MVKISIPTPCHEDWGAMTPNEQGRHCTSCAKTVVDFTGMSDEEVKYFFLNKNEDRVCGRFRNEQLHRITIELPQHIFNIPMPVWKKFLVAALLAYSATLFSCDAKINEAVTNKPTVIETTVGEMIPVEPVNNQTIGDTTIQQIQTVCTETVGVTMVEPGTIKGDIAIEPLPPPPIEVSTGYYIAPYIKPDTPVVKNDYAKLGEVVMIKPDTLKKKTTPKNDSGTCNTTVFY